MPLSVNHNSFVSGFQSNPTELRTPLAKISTPVPSGFILVMVANIESLESQTLHGAPTGTYNLPSGPKAMNFHP